MYVCASVFIDVCVCVCISSSLSMYIYIFLLNLSLSLSLSLSLCLSLSLARSVYRSIYLCLCIYRRAHRQTLPNPVLNPKRFNRQALKLEPQEAKVWELKPTRISSTSSRRAEPSETRGEIPGPAGNMYERGVLQWKSAQVASTVIPFQSRTTVPGPSWVNA